MVSQGCSIGFPVVIGAGSHPFPFRTRKLSLLPPMVLHGKLCGRVAAAGIVVRPATVVSRAFVCTPAWFPHRVSHALHGRHYLGRLACSAAVWESRLLPALSRARDLRFGGVRLYAGAWSPHTVSHALHGLHFLGRLA